MSDLDKILKFIDLLQQFRLVERIVLRNGLDRDENDVEHSYSLAMLAWFINDLYDLKLDMEKTFKYALVHDLLEVYAGDTFFYHRTQEIIDDKAKREAEGIIKLKEKYTEFPELHEIISTYEKKEDRESKFVYALDKIEPILNIYLDGGRTWRKHEITIEMLENGKKPKVALDPTIEKVFADLILKLKEEESSLFE